MQFLRMSWISIAAVWGAVLLVLLGFSLFFVAHPGRGQFVMPLMFWTFYGGLLIVSVGCAIGLPMPQAAFWRTLVLALIVQWQALDFGHVALVVQALSKRASVWFWNESVTDAWRFDIGFQLAQLCVALALAVVAALVAARGNRPTFVVQWRLLDLFVLTTFIALTLAILTHGGESMPAIATIVTIVVLLAAATAAGSGRRHAGLAGAFLAGYVAWSVAIEPEDLINEWRQAGLRAYLDEPDPYARMLARTNVLVHLLPVYAGLAVAMVTGLLFRPQRIAE